MAKKLYTLDFEDGSYPQIIPFVPDPYLVVPQHGVTLREAREELRQWAVRQVEHYRMIARAAGLARKEDIEAGSIYTDRV